MFTSQSIHTSSAPNEMAPVSVWSRSRDPDATDTPGNLVKTQSETGTQSLSSITLQSKLSSLTPCGVWVLSHCEQLASLCIFRYCLHILVCEKLCVPKSFMFNRLILQIHPIGFGCERKPEGKKPTQQENIHLLIVIFFWPFTFWNANWQKQISLNAL